MEEKLVTIKTTTFSKAQIIKNRFEQENIECFLKSINAIRATVPGGVSIRIKEGDLQLAHRIVSAFDEEERRLDELGKADKGIERILVPIDFSETSLKACSYAFNIAHEFMAEIQLVHVFHSPALDIIPVTESHTIQVNVDIIIRDIESKIQKEMDDFIKLIKKKFDEILANGVKLEYEAFSGDPAMDILDIADSYLPDIIVIGTKSREKLQSKDLNKFISQIIEYAKVPVLVVPDEIQINNINELTSILYATNFDETDFIAIRKLVRIIKPFNLKIHCVHISQDIENKWEKVKLESLENCFKTSLNISDFECTIITGTDVISRLNKYVENHEIGILALTTHKRNIISRIINPSTTKLMLHNTNVPLLVFHSRV